MTEQENIIHADIIIGADVHRRFVRKHISPQHPHSEYAGYIVWVIDTMNESDLPEQSRPINQNTGVSMLNGPHGFLFGSIIENEDGTATPGNRQIGCAWYEDRKSTRLNSSHVAISYAVFC